MEPDSTSRRKRLRVDPSRPDTWLGADLVTMPGAGRLVSLMTSASRPEDRCPNCGWTAEQVIAQHLLGCPLCYSALDSKIREVLRSSQFPGAADLVS